MIETDRVLYDLETKTLFATVDGQKEPIAQVDRIEYQGTTNASMSSNEILLRFPEKRRVSIEPRNGVAPNERVATIS